jgi:hypothetical protein
MSYGSRIQRHVSKAEHAAAIWAGNGTDEQKQAAIDDWGAKKPRRDDPEHRFHMELCRQLKLLVGPAGNTRNRLGVSWRSIAQEQNLSLKNADGERFNPGAQKAHARGSRRGILDIWVRWPTGMAWCDAKANLNQPTDDQEKFAILQQSYGDHCAFIWDNPRGQMKAKPLPGIQMLYGVKMSEIWLHSCGCPLLAMTTA